MYIFTPINQATYIEILFEAKNQIFIIRYLYDHKRENIPELFYTSNG